MQSHYTSFIILIIYSSQKKNLCLNVGARDVSRVCAVLPQSRKLDVYFEYEEKLMSKSTLDKSLLDIISDPDGTNTLCLTYRAALPLASLLD